ncbi:MAG: HPr family phosphocarrier protein [Vallitaleaceae bacterium]|jgi:phosphotransferase system HPr (HPr) family protein|nr:HPr family phosphocarrier protein [Vallitaleaceae bacterium]
MIEKKIEVKIPTGLETTPVAMFVQVVGQFSSNVYVSLQNKKVNGKSIMGMMSLGILEGEDVTVTVDGEDEVSAMKKIEAYLLANADN